MNKVIPLKNYETQYQNDYGNENLEQEYYQEIYERRELSRLHIIDLVKEEIIESIVINPDNVMNAAGALFKVTFNNLEQVDFYERYKCENQKCENSWITSKEKFINFPCIFYCRYTYRGFTEGFIAQYITKEEYVNELQRQLALAV